MYKSVNNGLTLRTLVAALSVMLMLVSCSDDDSNSGASEGAMITGTINFADDIDVGQLTRVEVLLLDVSRQDVAATVLGESHLENIEHLPIVFSVAYDENAINDRHQYSISVSAYMRDGGREVQAYRTTSVYPVLTRGHGNVAHVVVSSIR